MYQPCIYLTRARTLHEPDIKLTPILHEACTKLTRERDMHEAYEDINFLYSLFRLVQARSKPGIKGALHNVPNARCSAMLVVLLE